MKIPRFPFFQTLSARLALSLTILFGIVSTAGIIATYEGIFLHLQNMTDEELISDAETFLQQIAIYGIDVDTLNQIFAIETEEEGPANKFMRIVTADGKNLASSDMSSWNDVELNTLCFPGYNKIEKIYKQLNYLRIEKREFFL